MVGNYLLPFLLYEKDFNYARNIPWDLGRRRAVIATQLRCLANRHHQRRTDIHSHSTDEPTGIHQYAGAGDQWARTSIAGCFNTSAHMTNEHRNRAARARLRAKQCQRRERRAHEYHSGIRCADDLDSAAADAHRRPQRHEPAASHGAIDPNRHERSQHRRRDTAGNFHLAKRPPANAARPPIAERNVAIPNKSCHDGTIIVQPGSDEFHAESDYEPIQHSTDQSGAVLKPEAKSQSPEARGRTSVLCLPSSVTSPHLPIRFQNAGAALRELRR
jgi:hypothetical protein